MNTADTVAIRKAEAADAEVLTNISKRSFESDVDAGTPGPGGPPGYDNVKVITERINNRFLHYYTIMYRDSIAGGFIVGNRGPGYQVCEQIFIDPDNMRAGIGQKTFKLIWERYPAADLWCVGTPGWNTRTNPFYKKIGFKKIGITHDHDAWTGNYYQKRITGRIPGAMVKLSETRSGQYGIVVGGIVEKLDDIRTITSKKTGEELKVANAILSDGTGSVKLILWNDQIRQVQLNSKIRIENASVKDFNGELQLTLAKWGLIITLD